MKKFEWELTSGDKISYFGYRQLLPDGTVICHTDDLSLDQYHEMVYQLSKAADINYDYWDGKQDVVYVSSLGENGPFFDDKSTFCIEKKDGPTFYIYFNGSVTVSTDCCKGECHFSTWNRSERVIP